MSARPLALAVVVAALGAALPGVAAGAGTPVNVGTPSLTGRTAVGSTLTCHRGTWHGATSFRLSWVRDGRRIEGATGTTYATGARDDGASVRCQVSARNAVGTTVVQSNALLIGTPPPGRVNRTVHVHGGVAHVRFTCPDVDGGCALDSIRLGGRGVRIAQALDGHVGAGDTRDVAVAVGTADAARLIAGERGTVALRYTLADDVAGDAVATVGYEG